MSVFISYSRNDKAFVDRISTALINANIKVWKDEWKLGPGAPLTPEIRDAIGKASFLCIVLSDNASASAWVAKELEMGLLTEAQGKRLTIIPLIIADCKVPEPLQDYLYIDFRQSFDGALEKLKRFLVTGGELDGSHGIGQDSDYFNFYGSEAGMMGQRPFVDFDIVSLDREERSCVLTQIQCVGSPSTEEHFRVEGPSAFKTWVLRRCARHFDANPARQMLQRDKSVIGKFSLEDDTAGIKVDVHVRMKRLGEIRDQGMIFNFGALFQQICDTAKIPWREPEVEVAAPDPPASARPVESSTILPT